MIYTTVIISLRNEVPDFMKEQTQKIINMSKFIV